MVASGCCHHARYVVVWLQGVLPRVVGNAGGVATCFAVFAQAWVNGLRGLFHCGSSQKQLAAKGVQDITLMHVVCGGKLSDLEDKDRVRCQRLAGWFWWDGQLWTTAGGYWRVPPLTERVSIMQKAA